MEGILTTGQRERVGREVAMHAPARATASELPEATARVLDRLESLAASAAVWELWGAGEVEVAWDETRHEVSVHAAEPEDDEPEVVDVVSYPAPVE